MTVDWGSQCHVGLQQLVVILNIVDISPVHCLSTIDAERTPSPSHLTSRSQRRRRGVEQLVARHVRLRRHDGCWGRLATATTQQDDDDDDDDDVSDNDQLPRKQLLSAATTTSQSALAAVAATTTTHDDYGNKPILLARSRLFHPLTPQTTLTVLILVIESTQTTCNFAQHLTIFLRLSSGNQMEMSDCC